ncbi:class D sortase [Paenibacillus sp. PL2-23]|uniref:class D sortase n=1 Tax=Paenibacillus sp. PL2-23 TaxID=2100729 RepID=UPI0030FCF812
MNKLSACGLVVIGLFIIAFPKASEWYETRQEQSLLAEWEEAAAQEEANREAVEQYDNLTNLFAETEFEAAADPEAELTGVAEGESTTPSSGEASSTAAAPSSATPAQAKQSPKPQAIATIQIPSIDLLLPVLEGATESNMKVAAVHLKETTKLGEVGNAAIAAHRMRIKGRLFNRLDEVEVGDSITIKTKTETFQYKVYKVSIVEPSDVSVLRYNNTDRRLTLITCDPLINPTHRLIVHAQME